MSTRCPETDAVLARHLDGDVDCAHAGAGFAPAEAIAEHLRDCEACREALQRARRLDAALAEAAGRSLAAAGRADCERLLAAAVAAAGPAPQRPAAARRRVPFWLAGTALAGAGFLLAWWLRGSVLQQPAAPPPVAGGDERVDVPSPLRPPAEPSEPVDPGIPVHGAPAGTFARGAATSVRTREQALRCAAQLADEGLAPRLAALDAVRAAALGIAWPPSCAGGVGASAAETAAEARVRAGLLLLDATTTAAHAPFVRAFAALDSGPVLDRLLAAASQRAAFTARVRARLCDFGPDDRGDLDALAALTVGARLGRPETDSAVRLALRRCPAAAGELAAALRTPARAHGTAALLLDVWGDLTALGALRDDERAAAVLFAGMPACVLPQLRRELARAQATPRRVRCLLAAGVLAAPELLDDLLRWVANGNAGEALAAAWSLGELPPRSLFAVERRAFERSAWLLRAALARARAPGSARFAETLELTAEERQLLRTGGFTFAQFPVVAAWFRERQGH